MKVRLKKKHLTLPNCWKQCGVDKKQWDKLQAGEEIDIKTITPTIKSLIEKTSSPIKKTKGDK